MDLSVQPAKVFFATSPEAQVQHKLKALFKALRIIGSHELLREGEWRAGSNAENGPFGAFLEKKTHPTGAFFEKKLLLFGDDTAALLSCLFKRLIGCSLRNRGFEPHPSVGVQAPLLLRYSCLENIVFSMVEMAMK